MLNSDTKRRIDSARQILVGVVPDPKGQIDQITNALIYKFMDDMDRAALRVGGKAGFFVGDLEPYAWPKLMHPSLGNQERLNLYAEALAKFSTAKQLPELFRDIFRLAVLPHRNPEVLGLFLKEINAFTYDHSEDLGDAFEYLLSVMGSQGDAGQFRTPRHIIDFIVAVVAPTKNETVLDPACGTAGFLVSAYKHIQAQHPKSGKLPDGTLTDARTLTAAERQRLMTNFTGYDISPDMVRLSRVNMYLHGFPQPNIVAYDTLTSDARWEDKFDVILANPPFMSPKGGIVPHHRFQLQSSRSEVLFVDYIMTHLRPHGRAGVIVPEGIIFQSGKAHKDLRKLLVEDGLYAVVSLPAGVFNPYSGVKTSVLLFDRDVAKQSSDVLFVKIEADGLDLGAQRRPIAKNDLPEAIKLLRDHRDIVLLRHSREGGNPATSSSIQHLLIPKSRIAADGDYNLTGDRYRDTTRPTNTKWPMVKLGDVCHVVCGGTPSREEDEYWKGGNIKWLRAKYIQDDAITGYETITQKAVDKSAASLIPADSVVVITRVSVGKIAYISEPYAINQDLTGLTPNDSTVLDPHYLYWCARGFSPRLVKDAQGVGVRGVTKKYIERLEIPLPPLEFQKELAAELDGYQHIIHGAKEILANWKPKIEVDPTWPMVKLGEVCEVNPTQANPLNKFGDTDFVYIDIASVGNGTGTIDLNNVISAKSAPSRARREIRAKDVLLSTVRPNLKAFALLDKLPSKVLTSTGFAVLRASTKIEPAYLYFALLDDAVMSQMTSRMEKGAYPSINQSDVESLILPLPSRERQLEIAASISAEQSLMNTASALVRRYEDKIGERIIELNG